MQYNKTYIPWVLGLGLLLDTLDTTVLNAALPQMAISFSVDALTLKLAIISYLISLAVFIPISGYVTDRWGTKRVFFSATVVFLISSLLCGISQHVPELIIGRLFQGIGGAMITPVGRLILLKTFSRNEYIKAFTSLVLVGQLGIALGPALGGTLTTFLGWRWVFFINLPIGLILLALIVRFIPDYREEVRYQFDWLGFGLFSIAVGLITFGLALMSEQAFENMALSGSLVIAGLALLGVFAVHVKRCLHPLLNLTLLRIRTFRIAILGSLLIRLPLNAPFFLLTLLLQIEFGFSAFESGLFLVPYGVSMVLAKPFFQTILYRYGFRRCLTVTPIFLAGSLFSFSLITATTPAWVILLLVGLLGILSSFQFSGMNTLNFADIEKADTSHASIISSVLQQLAISFSVCFSAGLLVMASHFYHVETLNLASFHTTFVVLGGVMLLGVFLFKRLRASDGEAMLR